MPNPEKEQVVQIVNRLLSRSGLTIDQAAARMQAYGCDVSRTTFENRFTTRVDLRPNIEPTWLLAIIAAFTERLTSDERCTAAEAIELARLARLPIDQFGALKRFFPDSEFIAAYRRYAPAFGPMTKESELATSPSVSVIQPEKEFNALLTCQPDDESTAKELLNYLKAAGLALWPTITHLPRTDLWPPDLIQAVAACHTWILCLSLDAPGNWTVAGLPEPPLSPGVGVQIIPVLMPGARRGSRSHLPRWLQRIPLIEFRDDLGDEAALARLVTAIQAAIPAHAVGQDRPLDPHCPYRGLQVFDEAHAQFFFGREADTEWLLEALRGSRFLAVVGPSGSGKSSLVRAGLIPALRRGEFYSKGDPAWLSDPSMIEVNSQDWLIQILEPGRRPLQTLALALLKGSQGRLNRNWQALSQVLAAGEEGLHRLSLEVLGQNPGKSHLALVVDQFEEVFTLCEDEATRRAFIANLLYAASLPGGRAVVILTMRADFYGRAATYPDLAVYLADHQALVSPMSEAELTQAIIQPAQKVGLGFEPGLVDRLLVDTASEPGTLPLLQHTLLELWERRQGRKLTFAAYQAIGGVQGALAGRADSLLAEFSPAQEAILRRVMLRLTRLGEGTDDTRRRATFAELIRTQQEEADVRTVVTRLADARLVTTSLDPETGEETVDVAHEALIRSWPTLQGWLAEDREALRLHQRLAEAALEWERNGRDESYLYRGARLAAVEEWAAAHADELNQVERAFLADSLAARDAEAAAWERRRRRVILALAAGLVVALSLALLAFSQWRQVKAQHRLTLSRQLAAQARDHLDGQLDLALLLSAQAFQIADTFEARSSLLTALESSPHLTKFLRGHSGWVWSVAFSPDGQTLASGGADGVIILWDLATGQPLGPPLTGHSDWVRSIAFSPDGEILASGSADGTIILWDVGQGQPLGPPLAGHIGFVTEVAFSPDGHRLASAGADGMIILWEVATGRTLGESLTGHNGFVLSLAFSPDGHMLASAGADETILLWDVSGYGVDTGQPLAQALAGHQGAVFSLAFSPDGRTLASGGEDKSIILWDVSTAFNPGPSQDEGTGLAARQPPGPPLMGHQGPVSSLAFSPDGGVLASGGEDKTIILWDLETGQPLDQPWAGHTDRILDVAFSPDGQRLASGGADGVIILWDMAVDQPLAQSLTGHTLWVNSVVFSPDGRTLASGGADGTIVLWDLATRQPLGPPLTAHTSDVTSVAFSPDGRTLASGGRDRTVILWDAATRRPLGPPLTGHQSTVSSVAFSPDNQILASGSEDGTIILWDVTARQPLGRPLATHTSVKRLAFSPGGQILASGYADGSIILWNVATHQRLDSPLRGHSSGVLSLAFSPDGQILASGSYDGTIILWDVAARQPIRQPLTGHTDWVLGLAFSPDTPGGALACVPRRQVPRPACAWATATGGTGQAGGAGGQMLASGSMDNTIILWDVATHQPIGVPLTSSDRVWNIAFSPDGRTLASAGSNGVVMLWNVDPTSWQARACRIAARNLTREEWERYLGDETYRVTCPHAPLPTPEAEVKSTAPILATPPTPTLAKTPDNPGVALPAIIEEFDSSQGFIQTSPNVYIADGQVLWHYRRSGGEQYVYRSIPPFSGDVRLLVRGQVDSWTNNCGILAGIGDRPGSGLAISFGWFGGGCPTNGALVNASGVLLDHAVEDGCDFVGNWLWVQPSKPYTAELTARSKAAVLSVEGVGEVTGTVDYEDPYTTLWVGNPGDGDWPECSGTIDALVVEPLD